MIGAAAQKRRDPGRALRPASQVICERIVLVRYAVVAGAACHSRASGNDRTAADRDGACRTRSGDSRAPPAPRAGRLA